MTAPTWLTTQDVAALLGISTESVRRAITRKDWGAYSYGGVLRVKQSELDRFVEQHTTKPAKSRRWGAA